MKNMADTVLITGASQGIGKATSLLFASKGYDVVLVARQIDRLESVAQQIKDKGRNAWAISADVRDAEQVNSMVREALACCGSIDVLINNAGIYSLGQVEQYTLEVWHQIIDTNLWGYIHTIHALLSHFLERGKGTIVNVGSIGGKIPIAYQVPYTTSKYAVTGLTESLHSELSDKGIRVCGVHPNFIKTDLMERAIFLGKDGQEVQQRRELVKKAVQSPVLENPEDVAKAIWQAVKHPKAEIMVGSANLSQASYRLFPGLMDWIFKKTFGMKDNA
ncbi:MAG: SDR family oxidoreductase [Oscillatoriaceae cyanobacterium Prado104]|jgi:short-subunit dehydrogenase|nr:SDR family oxidoreductase [Oscillatoriaceae cyanobacterium Prado104]